MPMQIRSDQIKAAVEKIEEKNVCLFRSRLGTIR